MNRGNRNFLSTTTILLVAAICFMFAAITASGQGLSGHWSISSAGNLDNGEQPRTTLEITQTENDLSASYKTLGYFFDLRGTVTGNHFELNRVGEEHFYLAGDLLNGELHFTNGVSSKFLAKKAVPSDEIVLPAYIPPPALHEVAKNGLARTPPMGWNSWNLFAGRIDDQIIRAIADAMVSSGMRDAGYIYINIDDTWEGLRDAQGNLHSNHKFPDMKALADYVHSKGLKLGLYTSPGPRTCAGYPGSYGHEEQDAKMFAAWGTDYLKYDWCSAAYIYKDDAMRAVYQKMGDALAATGRPMVYSLCEYGMENVQEWGVAVGGNLWRTTGDINDSWNAMRSNIEKQAPVASFSGPGHWNDPDILEVGNGRMTDDEYRTHFSLWALAAAPLLAGNDVRHMSAVTSSILLNKEVIAIDQDVLGKQASPKRNGALEIWIKPLSDGGVAVGVVNLDSAATLATINARDLHLSGTITKARDLWAHQDVQFAGGTYSAKLPPHGVLLLRIDMKSTPNQAIKSGF